MEDQILRSREDVFWYLDWVREGQGSLGRQVWFLGEAEGAIQERQRGPIGSVPADCRSTLEGQQGHQNETWAQPQLNHRSTRSQIQEGAPRSSRATSNLRWQAVECHQQAREGEEAVEWEAWDQLQESDHRTRWSWEEARAPHGRAW